MKNITLSNRTKGVLFIIISAFGFAKTAGNYAGSLKGQKKAQELGYSQSLWLDGVEWRCFRLIFRVG